MMMISGIAIAAISGFGFLGQLVSALFFKTAVRWGLQEAEEDIDPTFSADGRGEAIWDAMILWVLPVGGVLMALRNPIWPYLALIGGGMYLYFGGRGIITRIVMLRRGIRIAKGGALAVPLTALALWGLAGIYAIALAVAALVGGPI